MKKTSASTLFNCYMWLVEVIFTADKITRKEIDEKWSKSVWNENKERSLPERTFHRWKIAAEELFGVNICCDRKTDTYSLEDPETLTSEEKGVHKWLFNALSVNGLIMQSREKDVQKCIFFEEIPSGQRYLSMIVGSLHDKKQLEITHRSFGRDANVYHVNPYCLKLFRQRWYLLGYAEEKDGTLIFSLDRIEDMKTSEKRYKIPKEMNVKKYFSNIYGVSYSQEKPERIRVKVANDQADYFRSLPLHHSQHEVSTSEEYTVFEFCLVPNFEFKQMLASYRSRLEVLSPKALRDEFRAEAERTLSLYTDD